VINWGISAIYLAAGVKLVEVELEIELGIESRFVREERRIGREMGGY
jgi:hypothetical protein